jgi:hypothetical protein
MNIPRATLAKVAAILPLHIDVFRRLSADLTERDRRFRAMAREACAEHAPVPDNATFACLDRDRDGAVGVFRYLSNGRTLYRIVGLDETGALTRAVDFRLMYDRDDDAFVSA